MVQDIRTDKLRRGSARREELSKIKVELFSWLDSLDLTDGSVIPVTDALKAAFAAADLDPADMFDQDVLLTIFAELHFGEPAKRGRGRKWGFERKFQLADDYSTMKCFHPKLSQAQICAKILEAFPQRYGNISQTTLLRRLLRK